MDFSTIIQNNNGLRPYQIEAKKEILNYWQNGARSVMLQMPTGTGKTMLFVSLLKDIWNHFFDKRVLKRFLILVHRKELVEQVQNTLSKKYGLCHGTILSGKKDNTQWIQVAMVQTLSKKKRLKHWKENSFDFIICDEAHHILADSYQKVRKTFPNAFLLGVTATPYRLNHQPFTDTFDALVKSMPINNFILQGYLSEYEYYSIKPTSKLQLEINNLKIDTTGDYSDRAMSNALDKRIIRAKVVETWLKYAKGKKTIVYTINKMHNLNLCNEFNEAGYKCVAIDSDTPKQERELYIEQFRKGEITIICNVNIFSEGFDCPDIECVQFARPTTSLSMFLQQAGRGLRPSKNKEKTIFLDNIGLFNRFGLPSAKRKWQQHFEGKPYFQNHEIDEKKDEKRYSPRVFDIEEADESIELQYTSVKSENNDSNVNSTDEQVTSKEESKNWSIANLAKELNMSVAEAIAYLKEISDENLTVGEPSEPISPQSILLEEEYWAVKTHYDLLIAHHQFKENFESIFDITPNKLISIKHGFYCKVMNYKTNSWEYLHFYNFKECYHKLIYKIESAFQYKKEKFPKLYKKERFPQWYKEFKRITDNQKFNILLTSLKKINEVVYFNFNFNENDKANKTSQENDTQELKKRENNDNLMIFYKDTQYNLEEINENQIIELMLYLNKKLDIQLIDIQKAQERIQFLDIKEAQEKIKCIENTNTQHLTQEPDLTHDELIELFELRKDEFEKSNITLKRN